MYTAGTQGSTGGGWVVWLRYADPGRPDRVYFAGAQTPAAIIDFLIRGKKTYIGQLELVWGTSPYTTLGPELRGRRAIHFIDNISSINDLILT